MSHSVTLSWHSPNQPLPYSNIVGLMKMGNIVRRAGLEPTSLAFWAIVLLLHHIGSWCRHYTHTYMSMQLLASEISADYYTNNVKQLTHGNFNFIRHWFDVIMSSNPWSPMCEIHALQIWPPRQVELIVHTVCTVETFLSNTNQFSGVRRWTNYVEPAD